MSSLNYLKMVIIALASAAFIVPAIATGFYVTYLIVAAVGN